MWTGNHSLAILRSLRSLSYVIDWYVLAQHVSSKGQYRSRHTAAAGGHQGLREINTSLLEYWIGRERGEGGRGREGGREGGRRGREGGRRGREGGREGREGGREEREGGREEGKGGREEREGGREVGREEGREREGGREGVQTLSSDWKKSSTAISM